MRCHRFPLSADTSDDLKCARHNGICHTSVSDKLSGARQGVARIVALTTRRAARRTTIQLRPLTIAQWSLSRATQLPSLEITIVEGKVPAGKVTLK